MGKSLFARGADFTASMTFMFASTNLVLELGVVLWLLIGWQFAVAEFVGGAVMIALLALVLPRAVPTALLEQARERLTGGTSAGVEAADDNEAAEAGSATRLRSRAGWSDAAGYAISDLSMLRKELVIGFVVAGLASVAVPVWVWQALFLTGSGWLSGVENVIVGPVLAFLSFVCSVGNVPLGAALWKGGISFGGVVAFIFADLLALPLVLIYRKFYGTRLAVRLSLVFWAVMSVAGLITEGLFRLLSLIPGHRPKASIATIHLGWNYTTVLNVVALVAFGYLYWLYRNRDRLGGGAGLAKDVVCGMQVRAQDAPARARHAGHDYYFCSDRCHDRFLAAPETFLNQNPGQGRDSGSGDRQALETDTPAPGLDPVCGMTVDPDSAAARAEHHGATYFFCSTGCRDAFIADPAAFTAAQSSR
ncbi:hypothetical protein GCM10009858_45970 [Terrabacter carboxydivorans]|uniref:TRASH domain-containing protein n=1 Tax=Terrabacter carboxydivorans TaxID=619730 RepID=A0ABP5ZQ80_9MICO